MRLTIVLICLFVVPCLAAGEAGGQPIWGAPVNLGPLINGSDHDSAPDLSQDGLTMFYEHIPGDIWTATRPSVGGAWSAPTKLDCPPCTEEFHEMTPSISSDSLTLYYTSTENVYGPPEEWDLCDNWSVSRETVTSPWGNKTALPANINTEYNEYCPEISADGLMLFIRSDRPGVYGDTDFYVCTRASTTDPWSDPVNLGPNVNSSKGELRCSISSDGQTLYFTSNRPGGYGEEDIYYSRYVDGEWTAAVNLGPTINTPYREVTVEISPDGSELFFSSDRPGGYGHKDLWVAALIPEPATLSLVVLGALGLVLRKVKRR